MKIYKWSQAALTYVIPILLSAVLYWLVCRVLWGKNALIHTRGTAIPIPNAIFVSHFSDQISTSSDPAKRKASKDKGGAVKEILSMRKNVVKMLICCVILFFVSYTPIVVNFITK